MIERHYRLSELCTLLAVDDKTIRRAVRSGALEAIKVGWEYRFAESAVQRWLDAGGKTRAA